MSGLALLKRRAWHFNSNPSLASRLRVPFDRIQQFAIGRAEFDAQQLDQLAKFIGYSGYDAETDTLR